jgi:serine/threonine protein kinase
VHGDIKLENICFKYSNQLSEVVLVDFSNSIFFQSQSQSNGPLAPQQRKLIGTSGYIAPEVFKGQKITDKVDIFSLGIILYILLYGVSPWQSKDEQSLTAENERCEIVFEAAKSRCGKLSLNSLDCLQKMLEKDP